MALNKIDGALSVNGRLTPAQFDCPAGSLTDAAISSSAAIDGTKLKHLQPASYSDPSATTTATVTKTLYRAQNAGTLLSVYAGNVAPCAGAATIVVDVKKNNVSVLSSTLTLNSANTARVGVPATINTALDDYVAGDLFEFVATATAGGGTLGTGFFLDARFHEAGQ